MNGQLSEQPLAELIREISAKNISGRLNLEQGNVKVVAYFKDGNFLYAASNVRNLRLADYLEKAKLISQKDLARFAGRRSDLALARTLCAENVLDEKAANRLQQKQVSDVLRVALLWTEGNWEFDSQSHLKEEVNFSPPVHELLLEAGRRLPLEFTAGRFLNPTEMISPNQGVMILDNLLPTEGFLLSRLQEPTVLSELVALSGLRELDALRVIYSLAIAGQIERENWKTGIRAGARKAAKAQASPPSQPIPSPVEAKPAAPVESLDAFLDRIGKAITHYEVLDVVTRARPAEIKKAYYQLARHYHPDRFRMNSDSQLHTRVESAFARITQAYETLKDERHRRNYDSKLEALAKVKERDSKTKAASQQAGRETTAKPGERKVEEPVMSDGERAELNFNEGLAALQVGQTSTATGLFGSAARAMPNDARYRAHYGHALAARETTRRLAEAELQAAVKLEPNNADYRVMLAELYRDLGFSLRARTEAERAVATAPQNQKARDLLKSLQ